MSVLDRATSLVALAGMGLLVIGCNAADPVAPAGSIITISATPTRIASNATSQIRVLVRKADGFPANKGTQVFLSTNVGRIANQLPTDDEGLVQTTLFGNGEVGTATVRANTGAADEASVDVQIGFGVSDVRLQASPTSVSETGGSVDLTAFVRDDVGQPLAGAVVNFHAEAGTLDSGGNFISTDAEGRAFDRLSLTASDLTAFTSDQLSVDVTVSTNDGSTLTDSLSITILRKPSASFSFSVNARSVNFIDTSSGNPTSWSWEFGDGASSNQKNPSHTYGAAGAYSVTLTVTNSQGSSSVTRVVTVS